MSPRTVALTIVPIPGQPPSRQFDLLPWFPGERVIDLMVLADASIADSFTFRILFGSEFGAFVDQIDGMTDSVSHFWMLYVDGVLSEKGVSETLVDKPEVEIEFRFEEPPAKHPQTDAKFNIKRFLGE